MTHILGSKFVVFVMLALTDSRTRLTHAKDEGFIFGQFYLPWNYTCLGGSTLT